MLVAGVNARDVHLFPFYGDIVCFEDCFDGFGNFSANAVTWKEDSLLGSSARVREEGSLVYRE